MFKKICNKYYTVVDCDRDRVAVVSPLYLGENSIDDFKNKYPDIEVLEVEELPDWFEDTDYRIPRFDYEPAGVRIRLTSVAHQGFASDFCGVTGDVKLSPTVTNLHSVLVLDTIIADENPDGTTEVDVLYEHYYICAEDNIENVVKSVADAYDSEEYAIVSPDMYEITPGGLCEGNHILVIPVSMKDLGDGMYEGPSVAFTY